MRYYKITVTTANYVAERFFSSYPRAHDVYHRILQVRGKLSECGDVAITCEGRTLHCQAWGH